jgi:hypothetical protein
LLSYALGAIKLKGDVTEDNSPILDYASPRKRVRFLLTAQSLLLLAGGADQVEITEKLAGDNGAIRAMVFAGFVLLVTLAIFVPFPAAISQTHPIAQPSRVRLRNWFG